MPLDRLAVGSGDSASQSLGQAELIEVREDTRQEGKERAKRRRSVRDCRLRDQLGCDTGESDETIRGQNSGSVVERALFWGKEEGATAELLRQGDQLPFQGGIGLDGDSDSLPGGGIGRTCEGREGMEGTGCGTGPCCCGEQFASERTSEMDDRSARSPGRAGAEWSDRAVRHSQDDETATLGGIVGCRADSGTEEERSEFLGPLASAAPDGGHRDAGHDERDAERAPRTPSAEQWDRLSNRLAWR